MKITCAGLMETNLHIKEIVRRRLYEEGIELSAGLGSRRPVELGR